MREKHQENILHVIVNANVVAQFATQIKNGIMTHANVSVKIIVHAKNFKVGILAHVFMRILII